MTEAELILLDAATSQEHYEHYHLLSGADLPIKKCDEIIDFFEKHHGLEFVNFMRERFNYADRVRYYRPFLQLMGKKSNILIRVLNKICLVLQKVMHVHRNKDINFQKGASWFSITDELARYVLSKRKWIKKVFHSTLFADESFIQTIIINSHFWERMYCQGFNYDMMSGAMRLIDWERGIGASPYTFRLSDLDMITHSDAMFARKFHPSVDAEIIEKIRELYS